MKNNKLEQMIDKFQKEITKFPDKRVGTNKKYSMQDIVFGAFSVFFTQSPSFLAHQRAMQNNKGISNARTIFKIKDIPTDNHIRDILDEVSPEKIYPIYDELLGLLKKRKEFKAAKSIANTVLIPLDGTQYFSSKKIHCKNCSVTEDKDGKKTYSHKAITPVIVDPDKKYVIALKPEFISSQDGAKKQDCEINAAKRWLKKHGTEYSSLGATILGDDLYCKQPFCKDVLETGFHFIFTCKPKSHQTIYEYVDMLEKGQDLKIVKTTEWNGKTKKYYSYRYANDIPVRDSKDALISNWCELTVTNKNGRILYKNAFLTDHKITDKNAALIVHCGRARWKIENENNNTLKNHGYNFEHNFGHGKKHLSQTMATLNILAFLMHTILEFIDSNYILLRRKLSARRTFFEHIKALTCYHCFKSWYHLLQFMLDGLERKHDPDNINNFLKYTYDSS